MLTAPDPQLKWLLGGVMIAYLVAMYGIAWFAAKRVSSAEDFLVAGRRLPLSLAWMTLLATWFGAGTLLAVSDEVRREGLYAAGLDPFGAGVCLLFVALFVAGPMWRMCLLTVPDFFGKVFGRRAEWLASAILVPSYFGWIAAQFIALAGMLELFLGWDPRLGLVVVAVVGTGYTLMGGMWSVTLTDAVQIVLVTVGLLVLGATTLRVLGDGSLQLAWQRLASETPESMRVIVPTADLGVFVGWLGVFLTGALGNVPVQDLMQRVFAADSERTAKSACWIAGVAYLVLGSIPLVLALSANLLFPDEMDESILPLLAQAFLSPALAVVFVVVLMSAVLSTIDSAILSPAGVLAQNVVAHFYPRNRLVVTRLAVVFVAVCSLGMAFWGEDAYALLEEAYALTLVGLFVPLMMGLYAKRRSSVAAIASMLVGTGAWGAHFALGWESFLEPVPVVGSWPIPVSLAATACGFVAYLIAGWRRTP